MENDTTYRLSYWEGPNSPVNPFHPEDNLIVGGGEISDDTTHRVPRSAFRTVLSFVAY